MTHTASIDFQIALRDLINEFVSGRVISPGEIIGNLQIVSTEVAIGALTDDPDGEKEEEECL